MARHRNSGKTTLVEALVRLLTGDGLRVAVIKHTHHHFDVDREGKDSYRFREAGSRQVMVASDQRWALLTESAARGSYPDLAELVTHLDARNDLILAEGFRDLAYPKIEATLDDDFDALLCRRDPNIIAVASKAPVTDLPVPRLPIDAPREVADFIRGWLDAGVP